MKNISYVNFIAIYNWMEKKSLKNFIQLYEHGFTYTGIRRILLVLFGGVGEFFVILT